MVILSADGFIFFHGDSEGNASRSYTSLTPVNPGLGKGYCGGVLLFVFGVVTLAVGYVDVVVC